MAASTIRSAEASAASLDHVIVGCNDLDRGIGFIAERTGVRAAFGGVHPGHGTRNALLSLGPKTYLEVIAPDPAQSALTWFRMLPQLSTPRLVGWAARVDNIGGWAARLRKAGITCEGPYDGSRARPDGRMLLWKKLDLADDGHGLLPFFIEWNVESPHPAADAPSGCRLGSFVAEASDPEELKKLFQTLGVNLPITRGSQSQLRAQIAGPKGTCELVSA